MDRDVEMVDVEGVDTREQLDNLSFNSHQLMKAQGRKDCITSLLTFCYTPWRPATYDSLTISFLPNVPRWRTRSLQS